MNIQEKPKLLPAKPGVYLMKNEMMRSSMWARLSHCGTALYSGRPPRLARGGFADNIADFEYIDRFGD